MLNSLKINDNSIDFAIDKLKTFVQINVDRDPEDKVEALDLFCQSVGLDQDLVSELYSKLAGYFKENTSYIFVGILAGLALAEHSLESNDN